MRAVWMTKHGGIEVLEVRETPDPDLQAGEVRIGIRTAGLNFSDVMARMGLYPAAPRPPCILGYEVSGVVDQVGSEVTEFTVGDRVLAMTSFGGHSDTVCVAATRVVKVPDEVSFETAAALPVNYLTAQHMLLRVAGIRTGDWVLVHMAAGGVGLALLQLCRIVKGVHVLGTASASKHEVLRQNGCEHPIDYRTKDYVSEVKRITAGQGVDAVFDPLGGEDWKRGYQLLRPSGRLIAFGFANLQTGGKRRLLQVIGQLARMPRFTPMKLMTDNRTVSGVSLSGLWGEPLMESLKELIRLCRNGELQPVIDSKFTFARVAEAYQRIERRKNVGKVILTPDLS